MESYLISQDISVLFGRTIKTMREKRQLTQENLSALADIGVPYISKLENGKANPSLKVISRLAFAFEVPLEKIFGIMEIA